VQEIQSNGTKSAGAATFCRVALVPATAVAVLAFAVPAHAGKPVHPPAASPTPAPVAPVDDSISTVPEAVSTVPETTETELPEMGVEPGASAPSSQEPVPATTPTTVEAPVEPTAPKPTVQKPKAPANEGTWVQVRTVQPRPVVRRSEVQRTAISPSRPVIHVRAPVARRHVHHPARHATRTSADGWYQVRAPQYQRSTPPVISSAWKAAPTRSQNPPAHAQNSSASPRRAPARATVHIRGKPANGSWICAQKAAKCLDSCADNVGWKVVRNDRWISGCKSPNAAPYMLDEDDNSGGEMGVARPGSESNGKPGRQYQCPGSQYHHYWCDDSFGESPAPQPDEDEPDVDEPDVDTDTPEEEPTSSCPETAAPIDSNTDEADSDLDNGGWDKPSRRSCDDTAADTPIRPGRGSEPPTGEQRPPAQVPQPPVPPALPQPAQVPPAPPSTEEPAAPTPTEPSAAPPPDAQPNTASEPPAAEPAPTPSVPPADAVPKNTRATRVGVTPPARNRNATPVSNESPVVVQPSTHLSARTTPQKTTPAPKKRVVAKPRAAKTPQLRKGRPTAPATRPATEVAPSQQPRVIRPVAGASKGLDGWLLVAMTLLGLSVLAFALAAVSEVDGGTAALTKMRSRLGSRGLSARRVGLGPGNSGAASSRAPDGIRYRD
jgi:hypothetical protein